LSGTLGKVSGKARVRVNFQQKTVGEFGVRTLGLKRGMKKHNDFWRVALKQRFWRWQQKAHAETLAETLLKDC
jgi:hypothetical protein